jgi:hypothetical protein
MNKEINNLLADIREASFDPDKGISEEIWGIGQRIDVLKERVDELEKNAKRWDFLFWFCVVVIMMEAILLRFG